MKYLVFLSLIILFIASNCKHPIAEHAVAITVNNNSNINLSFITGFNFPDTSIPDKYDELSGVLSHSFTRYQLKNTSWDKVFKQYHAQKISFFFFDNDTLLKYNWNNIRNMYKIYSRKDFTLQELKDQNYTVSYP